MNSEILVPFRSRRSSPREDRALLRNAIYTIKTGTLPDIMKAWSQLPER